MAKKENKSEFAGVGCFVQLIGLILFFFFPIGTIIGIALLILGGLKANKLICSNCGNPIEKTAKICPTCKESFE